MNFGFIGAGKVGFSLGKYLTERGVRVTGYYSRSAQSSLEAAEFTNTKQYLNLRNLVEDSDVLFVTVPDGQIASVWEQLKMLPIQDKMISHCSGSLSSAVFSDIKNYRAYGYSIHPFFAISNKYESYKELPKALFTMEGHPRYLNQLKNLFEGFGNSVETISMEDKTKYHASAVMVSNLYIGLENLCEEMLTDCGFSINNARKALGSLLLGNAESLASYGPVNALTGPIERGDVSTVTEHLKVLNDEESVVYKDLSLQTLKVARQKHPGRDYSILERVLKG